MNKLSTVVPIFLENGKKKILAHIAVSSIPYDDFFSREYYDIVTAATKKLQLSDGQCDKFESLGEFVMVALLARITYKWPDALVIEKVNDGSLLDAVFSVAEQMGDVDEALSGAEWVELWDPSVENREA